MACGIGTRQNALERVWFFHFRTNLVCEITISIKRKADPRAKRAWSARRADARNIPKTKTNVQVKS